MLGRHHLMLSIASAAIITMPFLDSNFSAVFISLIGVAIGSLIPDSDCSDATIFHTEVKGLKGNIGELINFFGFLFPIFGYGTKYFVYKPSLQIYDKIIFRKYSFEDKHRGFSHSILGILTLTVVTGVYMTTLLYLLGVLNSIYLMVFLSSYMIGGLLHMLEDSCTKTGITWNSPFSKTKLKGNLITSTKPKHIKTPNYFLYLLGIMSFISLLAGNILNQTYSNIFVSTIGLLATTISWMLFIKLIARTKIS